MSIQNKNYLNAMPRKISRSSFLDKADWEPARQRTNNMVQIVRSLDDISTGYSVFEKDQVLTHEQLNSVASYLDDQGRLTRVYLLGVGVVCGLRPSLEGDTVKITKGVGVTTDGDLLRLAADTVFDQFKAYDESAPKY